MNKKINILISILILTCLLLQNNLMVFANGNINAVLSGETPDVSNLTVSSDCVMVNEYQNIVGWTLSASEENASGGTVYADIDDSIIYDLMDYSNITVNVTYYDKGYGWFKLMYDSVSGSSKRSETVFTQDTGMWKTYSFQLDRASFKNRCSGNDFAVTVYDNARNVENEKYSPQPVTISEIEVIKDGSKECVTVQISNNGMGNISFEGEIPEFDITLKNRLSVAQNVTATYKIFDNDENMISEKSEKIEIGSRASLEKTVSFPVNEYGIYRLKVELSGDDLYADNETEFSYCIKNTKQNSQIGIGTGWAYSADEIELYKNAGIKLARVNMNWEMIEENGKFSVPDSIDGFIDSLIDADIEPMIILGTYHNSYLDSNKGQAIIENDDALKAFGEYVTFVAEKYKGRVSHYEVWNEPDNGNNSKITGSAEPDDALAENYLKMCRVAYNNVKAVDETAEVGILSISGAYFGRINWAESVLEKMDAKFFDYITLHTYTTTNPPELRNIPTQLQNWKAMIEGHGFDCNDGFWMTEFGNNTSIGAVDSVNEKSQADRLIRQLAVTSSDSMNHKMYVYDFADAGLNPMNKEHNYGIVKSREYENAREAKPAYIALSAYNKMVGNATDCEQIKGTHNSDIYGNNFVYKYSFEDKDVFIIWCLKGTDSININEISERIPEFYDIYGNEKEILGNSIPTSQEPLYAVVYNENYVYNFPTGNVEMNLKMDGVSSFIVLNKGGNLDDEWIGNIEYIDQYNEGNTSAVFAVRKSPWLYNTYINGESNIKFTAINDAIEEINIYKDMDLIENLNGLLSGDVLTVSVKIPEDYKEEKQCLIAGFYKSGKLVGTEINSETQKDELGFINHKLTLPDTTEFDSVKIFLWNSETGMIPLRNSKYYA